MTRGNPCLWQSDRGDVMRNDTNYFLLENEDRDIIVHGETGFRVNVFAIENHGFTPTKGELHIFGCAKGKWFAFETTAWSCEAIDLVTDAVVWYARYHNNANMHITTEYSFADPN
jgi:hypothetical protein